MDQKLLISYQALHPRDNIDRLYVSRKERERGLASNENCIAISMQNLEDYVQKENDYL